MPQGYDPVRQVLINSFINYWIPTYRSTALGVLAALAAITLLWVRRRRQRHRAR
jgi:hypothetical protein